jgi:hypothetical protein
MPLSPETFFESSPRKVKFTPASGAQTITAVYKVTGTDDYNEIINYAIENDNIPYLVTGAIGFAGVMTDVEAQQHGKGSFWTVQITWEVPPFRADDGETPPDSLAFSWDTTGGSAHITQSLEVIDQEWASGIPHTDRSITIGEDDQGNVTGADIPVPSCRFEVVEIKTLDAYSPSSAIDHYRKTGKANSSDLTIAVSATKSFTFSAGEAMFLGARTSYDPSSGNVQTVFVFLGQANKTSITVGDMTVASKKGHDLLVTHFVEKVDATTKVKTKKPSEVVIHRVVEFIDLNGICGL